MNSKSNSTRSTNSQDSENNESNAAEPCEAKPHLLSIAELTEADIVNVLDLAAVFAKVDSQQVLRMSSPLHGRTVALLFYENSTRTRLSFEIAAKRLSASILNFSVASSSMNKGESLRDTVKTIEAMGMDVVVVRHSCAGVPNRISEWVDASVVNAGDGWHEHPTQALLDVYTARNHFDGLEGIRVTIVGDIRHSRVARSNVLAFTTMGADVTLVAPKSLLPSSLLGWPVAATSDLDSVLADTDICYLLRIQRERQNQSQIPSLREYRREYGLTRSRADCLPRHTLIMHPGPMNQGVEIDGEVAYGPNTVITEQVSNGIAVRMAVLSSLFEE